MKELTVIVTTYKAPECLDLCLQSIISGQVNNNEILVVVDGTYELNKEILTKYKSHIKTLVLQENVGLIRALNFGVYNASKSSILVVNDDNVFPKNWDAILWQDYDEVEDIVLSPNQIEPYDSMFRQFIKFDFGRNPTQFNLSEFQEKEPIFRKDTVTNEGSTFPFLMKKINYMKIGGWDECYQSGHVVDWEFFFKCNLNNYKMLRTYKCNFYHFVSVTLKSKEDIEKNEIKEKAAFEFFKYKWGNYPKHDSATNLKTL